MAAATNKTPATDSNVIPRSFTLGLLSSSGSIILFNEALVGREVDTGVGITVKIGVIICVGFIEG